MPRSGLAEAHGGTAWYEPNQPGGACLAIRAAKASGYQLTRDDSNEH